MPLDLEDLRPSDLPDYMVGAWLGCVHWAAGDAEIVRAFQTETGCRWTPARSPIDALVDEATGATETVFRSFVAWVNANIWGPLDPDVEE